MKKEYENKSAGLKMGLPVCEICKVASAGFETRDKIGKQILVCGRCVDHPGMTHVRVIDSEGLYGGRV